MSEDIPHGKTVARVPGEEYVKVELELEREKIALERERLAHERERLSLERLKMQADSDFFDSRRRYVMVPPLALVLAVFFLLMGLGLGAYLLKDSDIRVGRRAEAPIHLKTEIDGIEREGTAYLLFVK